MTETQSGLENKAGAGDPNALIGELMGAFESYKETNDGRMAQLEKRGAVDPLTEEKLGRLDAALDNAKAAIEPGGRTDA